MEKEAAKEQRDKENIQEIKKEIRIIIYILKLNKSKREKYMRFPNNQENKEDLSSFKVIPISQLKSGLFYPLNYYSLTFPLIILRVSLLILNLFIYTLKTYAFSFYRRDDFNIQGDKRLLIVLILIILDIYLFFIVINYILILK